MCPSLCPNLLTKGLQNEDSLVNIERYSSIYKNTKRAEPLLKQSAQKLGMQDPQIVTPASSKMLLNFIYTYCNSGTPEALSIDSLNALVQALPNTYSSYGHIGPWRIDLRDNSASGNPLVGNEDIQDLRSSHKVYLSHIGRSKKRAGPLPIALVCEHALRFWFGSGRDIGNRYILPHATLIIDLNLGLGHDEVNKMKVENVSVIPGISGTGSILLLIPVSVKNSMEGREYVLRSWPGNSK